jgi:hypothetical protein
MFTTKTPKSQKLREKSVNIIDVFTETKRQLQDVNDQVDMEESSVQSQIELLTAQLHDLAATREQNSRVVANINKILE